MMAMTSNCSGLVFPNTAPNEIRMVAAAKSPAIILATAPNQELVVEHFLIKCCNAALLFTVSRDAGCQFVDGFWELTVEYELTALNNYG